MNWNDELCGVEITPENWEGGIVEFSDGRWGHGLSNRPIFPPRGFAGKTDAELWFGLGWHQGYPGTHRPLPLIEYDNYPGGGGDPGRGGLWIDMHGDITMQYLTCVSSPALLPDPAALQQAIGNALTLHARLTEVRDG